MKLEIFRPEDFEAALGITRHDYANFTDLNYKQITERGADSANARLNEWLSQNAKKVYGRFTKVYGRFTNDGDPFEFGDSNVIPGPSKEDTHVAMLICIEPIEKCSHPKSKIRQMNWIQEGSGFNPGLSMDKIEFKCECGAKVEPVSFEEIT